MAIATAGRVGLQARSDTPEVARRRSPWYSPGMTASLDDKLIARIKAVLLTCTRTELAARCGVSHATLGRALNGFPVGAPTRKLIALEVGK